MLSVVLITGAGGGLGREVARRLAAAGDTVFVSARDPEKARRTAGELDGDVRALPVGLDVSDDAACATPRPRSTGSTCSSTTPPRT